MSTEPQADEQPLPVNLHFRDQRALTVDIDSIMRRGLRMRRSRRALAGGVAAVAIGALGVSAAYLASTPSTSAPAVGGASSTGFQQSGIVRDHPPAGGRVTVLGSQVNPMAPGSPTMSVVAWLSRGQLCSGVADLKNTASDAVACASRPSALSTAAPAVLAPRLVADFTDQFGRRVAIGFVSGDVAKVSLKIRGQLYTAATVPLSGATATGAYMFWIGGGVFVTGDQDLTQITGYDSHGVVVAGGHS